MVLVDKIQKIPVKTRIYGFIAFLCVLGGLFLYFIRIPMHGDIMRLESSIETIQANIQKNDMKIKNLDDLKLEVETLRRKLKEMSEQLPKETEVSTLLGQIQGLVNKSGLTLILWKPEQRRTHSSGLYVEIPVTVNLTGGYHNVGKFFDSIGKLTRIVNMVNIKMDGAKIGPSGALEVNVNCTAMTFAAAEKKVETAPNTPAKKVQ